MQTLSSVYNSIISGKYRVRTKFVSGATEYESDVWKSATIDGELFDELTIGNANIRELKLVLKSDADLIRGAQIDVKQQVYNSEAESEWISKGTFFVSKRVRDEISQTVEITAYDALRKADVPFLESGTWVSVTALNIVELIAADIGVPVEANTLLLLNDSYVISHIPSIGTDGTTGREMLMYIGTLYGGNWTITDENELKLIRIADTPEYTSIGLNAGSCKSQDTLPAIGRVKLINDESEFVSGSGSGTMLIAESPYATGATAERVLSMVAGYAHVPYKATRAYIEPAAGLGDGIELYEFRSVIARQTMTVSNTSPSDISAEVTEEEDEEYPYESPTVRSLKTADAANSAKIQVNSESIQGEIEKRTSEASEIKTNYSTVQQTVDGIIITLGEKIEEADAERIVNAYGATVEQYLRFANGILELGENNSQFKALLSNTRLAFTGASGTEVAWISNNQLFIKQAVIEGDIVMDPFVQRISTSGHFQIVYTGS